MDPAAHDPDVELAAHEARLESELAELTRPPQEVGNISFGKRVGEGTSMAVDRLTAVSTQEQLLAILADVKHARERVAEGTHGTCEVCGEQIPVERLEARPWSSRCVRHA